jgi:hypothetical protein
MKKNQIIISNINEENIKNKIYTIRGQQVMLDRDLAKLYGVETKVFNQAVRRNSELLPDDFMFQLTKNEFENLRSQFVTSNWGGRRYFPYVFTEQGIAMLSGVLKSYNAKQINIQIMRTFVAMKKFLTTHGQLYQKIDTIEQKQIEHKIEADKKFDYIFNALENREELAQQGIFYEGQIFDAYKFVSDIIRKAKTSITLIDNYVDDTVLTMLAKRKKGVSARILTQKISQQLQLDIDKHNAQYPKIELQKNNKFHDRFLFIDKKIVYHIGASLKDLGKKIFAFSKIETQGIAKNLKERIGKQ